MLAPLSSVHATPNQMPPILSESAQVHWNAELNIYLLTDKKLEEWKKYHETPVCMPRSKEAKTLLSLYIYFLFAIRHRKHTGEEDYTGNTFERNRLLKVESYSNS